LNFVSQLLGEKTIQKDFDGLVVGVKKMNIERLTALLYLL